MATFHTAPLLESIAPDPIVEEPMFMVPVGEDGYVPPETTDPPAPPYELTEGWSRTGFNEFTYNNDGVGATNSPLRFLRNQVTEGHSYHVTCEYAVMDSIPPNSAGCRCDVRAGGNGMDSTNATNVFPFAIDAIGVMNSSVGNGILFQTYTNLTMDLFVIRNVVIEDLGVIAEIVMPDMSLTVEQSSNQYGYSRGNYGSVTPDMTTDNFEIRRLTVRNSNGRTRLHVEGNHLQNSFTSMEIIGVGTLLTADATYQFIGGESKWDWAGTGFSLTDATVYAVEFN